MAQLPGRYLVMAPSAGKPANRWPAERFGELAARLELPTVVIGGAGEAKIAADVVRHAKGKAISLAGRTGLAELMAVLKRASFMVANDTGPMHLAVALGVPVFAIFGPANPVRTGPYGTTTHEGHRPPVAADSTAPGGMDAQKGADASEAGRMPARVSIVGSSADHERQPAAGARHTVIRQEIDCAPCYRWQPCSHWRCLLDLDVDTVHEIIINKLNQKLNRIARS